MGEGYKIIIIVSVCFKSMSRQSWKRGFGEYTGNFLSIAERAWDNDLSN